MEEESTEQSFWETAARKSTFSFCIRHSLKSKKSTSLHSQRLFEAEFSNSVCQSRHTALTFRFKTQPGARNSHRSSCKACSCISGWDVHLKYELNGQKTTELKLDEDVLSWISKMAKISIWPSDDQRQFLWNDVILF